MKFSIFKNSELGRKKGKIPFSFRVGKKGRKKENFPFSSELGNFEGKRGNSLFLQKEEKGLLKREFHFPFSKPAFFGAEVLNMENEKRTCETCRWYCHGSEKCVVKVWDEGQVWQMDPKQVQNCSLWEK